MADLVVSDVTKAFGEKTVLQDVSIRIQDHELVSLLGVSGGGKTTLFNVISGLLTPDRGQVLLDGEDITGIPGKVSYMLQKDLLLPYRTVEDNVALPLVIGGMKKKEARQKVAPYFEEFGLLGTEKKYPAQLSGGMRQRAALLRTYLFSDRLALLDEPFSALDTLTKRAMHRWYLDVMEQIHLSTIFITHDIDEAVLLSDRIYILGGETGADCRRNPHRRAKTETERLSAHRPFSFLQETNFTDDRRNRGVVSSVSDFLIKLRFPIIIIICVKAHLNLLGSGLFSCQIGRQFVPIKISDSCCFDVFRKGTTGGFA